MPSGDTNSYGLWPDELKRTRGKTMIYKHYTEKQRLNKTNPTINELMCSGNVSSSCSTSDTHCVTVKWHEYCAIWK